MPQTAMHVPDFAEQPILAGHLHFTMQDGFSPTARQYVVGGNYMFHGQEVLFS